MRKKRTTNQWVKWTPKEDARLKQLVAEGKTSMEIAAFFPNRTYCSVANRKYILEVYRPYASYKLSPRDPSILAQILKFKMLGWTHKEIADVFGVDISPGFSGAPYERV